MRALRKKSHLTIRFTDDQLAKIRRAAKIESRKRGEIVEPGGLLRELVMPRIEEILAAAILQPSAVA